MRLQALVRYWRDKRGQRPIPLRADIDPLEIPRLLSVVLMADVVVGGARIRLLGSEATNALGHEPRGRMITDIDLGEFTQAWREAFAAAVLSCEPVEAGGMIYRQGVASRADLVLMPLTLGSGSIDQIFGGLIIKSVLQYAASSHNAPVTYVRENPREHSFRFDDAASGSSRARGGGRID